MTSAVGLRRNEHDMFSKYHEWIHCIHQLLYCTILENFHNSDRGQYLSLIAPRIFYETIILHMSLSRQGPFSAYLSLCGPSLCTTIKCKFKKVYILKVTSMEEKWVNLITYNKYYFERVTRVEPTYGQAQLKSRWLSFKQ